MVHGDKVWYMASLVAQMVVSACDVEDPGSIPGSGRSSGEGNGNLLQYPCLENPMDGGALYATVCGVIKSRTQLTNFTFLHGDKTLKCTCSSSCIMSVI